MKPAILETSTRETLATFGALVGLLALDEAYAASLQPTPKTFNAEGFPTPTGDALATMAGRNWTAEQYYIDQFSVGDKEDVVVIPVTGVMTRGYSYGNSFSNEFMASMLRTIAEDKSKKGVIVFTNTGGGSVDSLDEFNAAIRAFSDVKPIVALVQQCLSGGLWAASATDHIFMVNNNTSRIGSIGTIYVHDCYAESLKNQGIDRQIFRSTGSDDKARLNPSEPLTDALKTQIQAELDDCNKLFKAAVRAGRGAKITSDEAFTGKAYNGKDGIKLGLADEFGTMQTAYNKVIQLSTKQ